jgi:hypothetical protein
VSGAAHAAPTIDVRGLCPSVTVTLAGATPNRQIMLFTGDPSGATTLGSGPCQGTVVDVADANQRQHQLLMTRVDAVGALTFSPASMSRTECASGSLQGLDLTTCEVTEPVSLQIDCSTVGDGLVSHWPANGNTRDVIGDNDGVIEGTVNYVPGVFGDAFEFDARSAVKVFPDKTLVYDDGEPFTYAMWIYQDGSVSGGHLFGKRHSCTGGPSFDYQLVITPVSSDLTTYNCTLGVPAPSADEWHHLVAMYDGSEFREYIDGALAGASTCSAADEIPVTGAELRIGSSGTCGSSGNQGWVGWIDDVNLWNRALDADEVVCVSNPKLH